MLFVAETWVLTAEMSKKLEGVCVLFPWKVTGKKTRRLDDDS